MTSVLVLSILFQINMVRGIAITNHFSHLKWYTSRRVNLPQISQNLQQINPIQHICMVFMFKLKTVLPERMINK